MGVKIREKVPGSGEWWIFVNHRGQRKAVKVGSKQAAKDKKVEIEKALTDGKLKLNPGPTSITFEKYAEKWLAGHVTANLKPSSYTGYNRLLNNHILPVIGSKPLSEITREEIKDLCYQKREAGLSPKSVQYIAVTIGTIFNHAREDGLVDRNPAEKIGRFLKVPRTRRDVEFLTAEEARVLLDAAKEHFPRWYPLFFTALRTGMRKGELAALQWGDIDWRGKFIEVKRNAWEGRITTPKNGKARRIDMSDQLAHVLEEHKRTAAVEALKRGESFLEYVFNSEVGPRYSGGRIWEMFARCLKKAKLRHVPFHATRHSFASMLIANGEPLAYVKEQMGHSSIQMTVDIYGHLVPGANRQAVNRLDDPEWSHAETKKSATPAQPAQIVRPVEWANVAN